MIQVCRAGNISVDETALSFSVEFLRCSQLFGLDVGSIEAKVFCANGSALLIHAVVGFFTGIFDGNSDDEGTFDTDIEIDVKIQAKPPNRYPTFVPTASALGIDPRTVSEDRWTESDIPATWRDVYWEQFNQPHFNASEGQCRFLSYHLSDLLKGDGDGFAACPVVPRDMVLHACGSGGMSPGRRLDPGSQFAASPSDFCDCDDSDPTVFPGAQDERNCVQRPIVIDGPEIQ